MTVGWKESHATEWCVRRQFAAAASACFTDACFADRTCFHWCLQFNRLRYVINPDSNIAANIWQGITTLALVWVALVTPLQAGLGLTWRLRPTRKNGKIQSWEETRKGEATYETMKRNDESNLERTLRWVCWSYKLIGFSWQVLAMCSVQTISS